MLPYAYLPATYGTMQFTENSRIYPPVCLVRTPLIGSYADDCITNEPTVRDSAKENHHGDYNSFYIDSTIPTWAREWQLYETKNSSGEHPPKVIMRKEEYLDDILRNAYQFSKAKTKDQNATATALGPYALHRSYLRSLKKKKLKSFMVRDLIDLPADERHSDSFDANPQYQNMLPRTELTPPPEPEIAWKNYELSVPENQRPRDTINNKPEPYSQGTPCSFTDAFKPFLSDPDYDSLQSRLDQSFNNGVTSSSDPSVICEPSARTAISPDSLGANSEPCSGDSGVSPCPKSKRIRTIFSCSQLERLEMEFERTQYMVGSERSQLASELNLRESQVKVWFQNRRIKQRKQLHEQQQAILSKLKKSEENDSQADQENNSNEDNALSTTWCEDNSC